MVTEADIRLADGRVLHAYDTGASADGGPRAPVAVFWLHGSPNIGSPPEPLFAAAEASGLRWVSYDRPGYGGSAPHDGRTIASAAADVAAVADALGLRRFAVLGHSGGGPHALACAARLPGALGAMIVAGLAPSESDGLDLLEGMSADNRAEWTAALTGEASLRAYVESVAPSLMSAPTEEVHDDSLPQADLDTLNGPFVEELVAASRDALRPGIDGWIDDELAFTAPWGFDVGEVRIPVDIWHGSEDVNVPFAHGRWLVEHLPNASLHREDGHGHLSIVADSFAARLDALIAVR